MITFNNADTSFRLRSKRKIKNAIINFVNKNDFSIGEINYILCSDAYLLDINKKYLNHDYYTDIISFQYDNEIISGDIYISIDRVRDNAVEYGKSFSNELYRVLSHGILHFMGFKDKTSQDTAVMRAKEEEMIAFILKNLEK